MPSTVVVQSHSALPKSGWLACCQESVCDWAKTSDFHYDFVDDELFSLLPDRYLERHRNRKLVLTDMARLLWIKKLVESGWERVIWVDVDILIFDPSRLVVPTEERYYLSKEVWPAVDYPGSPSDYVRRANNSICAFSAGNTMLEFLVWITGVVALSEGQELTECMAGTELFEKLQHALYLPLLHSNGVINPALAHEIVSAPGPHLRTYRRAHGSDIHAANLCHSLLTKSSEQLFMADEQIAKLCNILLETKGEVVNAHV